MKLVHALLAMAVITTLENVASTAQTFTPPPPKPRTPGPHGLNLNGKMFTLSYNGGGISFYPPSPPSTPSYTTSPYYTTTTKYPYTTTEYPYTTTEYPYTTTEYPSTITEYPYTTTEYPSTITEYPYTTTQTPTTTPPYTPTTAPSPRGVSVCLRYLNDFVKQSYSGFFTLFTLSPSRAPLQVDIHRSGGFTLKFNSDSDNTLYLTPSITFWSNIGPDIWSRVCLTVDSMKNVVQMFSGSNISIRKVIPYRYDQYVWSGEPVIEFPGFDGQVTDVQMWDYPLSYREVFKYMTSSVHGSYHGSVLTWSSISYTPSKNTLLEDVYERQTKQQISGRRRGRRPKGERKNRKFVHVEKD